MRNRGDTYTAEEAAEKRVERPKEGKGEDFLCGFAAVQLDRMLR